MISKMVSDTKNSLVKRVFSQNIFMIIVAILIIWITFSILTDGSFMTPRNISNLLRQMSITGVLAIGMVFIIISGEIDLSVGSQMALLGGIAAILNVKFGMNIFLVVMIPVVIGLIFGLWTGFWVSLKMPSFIITLGGMLAFRGILVGLTGGQTIAPISPGFELIGQSYIPDAISYLLGVVLILLKIFLVTAERKNMRVNGITPEPLKNEAVKTIALAVAVFGGVFLLNSYYGVPTPVVILVVFMFVFSFISRKTVFGRVVYAIGGNIEAARLSGINTNRVKVMIYVINGFLVAVAGLMLTSRLGAGSVSAGTNAELDAIASCFIGGASMSGGIGTVFGAVLGALVMSSIDNGMSMMNVAPSWQYLVKGLILIFAVYLDILTRNKKRQ